MFNQVTISTKEYRELIETKIKYDGVSRALVNELGKVLKDTFNTLGNVDWEKIAELKAKEKLDDK